MVSQSTPEGNATSMNIRARLTLLLSVLFICIIANAFISFKMERHAEEKLAWVIHTHDVIILTEHYLSAMQDAETGQRGYLLTKNLSYLAPYHTGLLESKESFDKLKFLTRDNAIQQNRLVKIRQLMKLKLNELKQTIELQQTNQSIKALGIVKENIGKEYMDEIRRIIRAFISDEKILLEKRKGDYRAYRSQLTSIILFEIFLFIFMAIMTYFFITRNLFKPLYRLIDNTHKMEEGEKIDIGDIVTNDEIGYLIASFYKMHEKVYARTQVLKHKATHDVLTGLKNRSDLLKIIDDTIISTNQDLSKLALLYIDINDFKQYNDKLGHEVGDSILREAANRLRESTRENDMIFRIGGDEFLVLLTNIHKLPDVESIVKKILTAFNKPLELNKQTILINLSIGIALSPDDSALAIELIRMADKAMYTAKKEAESHYSFHHDNRQADE